MLDEKSIDLKLENLKEEILQASAHNMRVILESSVDKKLNLILESSVDKKLNLILEALQEQIKTLASSNRVDAPEDEIIMLRSVVKKHTREIEELKHA